MDYLHFLALLSCFFTLAFGLTAKTVTPNQALKLNMKELWESRKDKNLMVQKQCANVEPNMFTVYLQPKSQFPIFQQYGAKLHGDPLLTSGGLPTDFTYSTPCVGAGEYLLNMSFRCGKFSRYPMVVMLIKMQPVQFPGMNLTPPYDIWFADKYISALDSTVHGARPTRDVRVYAYPLKFKVKGVVYGIRKIPNGSRQSIDINLNIQEIFVKDYPDTPKQMALDFDLQIEKFAKVYGSFFYLAAFAIVDKKIAGHTTPVESYIMIGRSVPFKVVPHIPWLAIRCDAFNFTKHMNPYQHYAHFSKPGKDERLNSYSNFFHYPDQYSTFYSGQEHTIHWKNSGLTVEKNYYLLHSCHELRLVLYPFCHIGRGLKQNYQFIIRDFFRPSLKVKIPPEAKSGIYCFAILWSNYKEVDHAYLQSKKIKGRVTGHLAVGKIVTDGSKAIKTGLIDVAVISPHRNSRFFVGSQKSDVMIGFDRFIPITNIYVAYWINDVMEDGPHCENPRDILAGFFDMNVHFHASKDSVLHLKLNLDQVNKRVYRLQVVITEYIHLPAPIMTPFGIIETGMHGTFSLFLSSKHALISSLQRYPNFREIQSYLNVIVIPPLPVFDFSAYAYLHPSINLISHGMSCFFNMSLKLNHKKAAPKPLPSNPQNKAVDDLINTQKQAAFEQAVFDTDDKDSLELDSCPVDAMTEALWREGHGGIQLDDEKVQQERDQRYLELRRNLLASLREPRPYPPATLPDGNAVEEIIEKSRLNRSVIDYNH